MQIHRMYWPVAVALGAMAGPAWAGSIEPYWHFSGVFHPALAHFPIALLTVAALIELKPIFFQQPGRKPGPGNASYVCLTIGTLAAIVAATVGWANADASGDFNGTLKDVMYLHRWLGVAVAAVAVVAWTLGTISRRRSLGGFGITLGYRGGTFVAAALVGLVGSLGGKLTHGVDYYADAYEDMVAALEAQDQPRVADVKPSKTEPVPTKAGVPCQSTFRSTS